jgi:hypothetical protein
MESDSGSGVYVRRRGGRDRSTRKGGGYDRAKRMVSNKQNRVTPGRGAVGFLLGDGGGHMRRRDGLRGWRARNGGE